MKKILILSLLLYCQNAVFAAEPQIAPNAPQDKPLMWDSEAKMDKAMAPYIAQARATYPQARARFMLGLPPGQSFFITMRLRDAQGNGEQVFVAVDRINFGTVSGRIWSDLKLVQGYKRKQSISFPEADMLDWLITKPDGSEEGNFVGKFLDTRQAR